MASKKARLWLAEQGIALSHNGTEQSNFAAGTGFGPFALPYHIVRMDTRYGDSKQTVDWAETLEDARKKRDACNDAVRDADEHGRGGAEWCRGRRINHYIRDIRTDETVS
jgi:hypothetical protein